MILQDFDNLQPFRFIDHISSLDFNLDNAYALQRRFRDLRCQRGEKVVGFKVGCTSPKIRIKLDIEESVYGHLWDVEQMQSSVTLNGSKYRQLGIEGELGVWLISTEGPPAAWVVEYEPIIELHHFVFDGEIDVRALELVARNCIHAGVVHGDRRIRCRLDEVPITEPMSVRIDDCVVETSKLQDLKLLDIPGPVGTVSWLASRLQKDSTALNPGDFLLTATAGNIYPLKAGSRAEVTFMGSHVSCNVE